MDSGIGGFSVVLAVREFFPHSHIVYFADPLHFPYGEKTKEELLPIVQPVFDFLVNGVGVEVLLVACGTVSSLILPEFYGRYSVPLVGIVEPACKEALRLIPEGMIGVLATRATIRVGAFRQMLAELRPGVEVLEEAWPDFIEAVERGNFDTPFWRTWTRARLEMFYEKGVRGLIMGCTHFALISSFFEEMASGLFPIVNPASSCAQEARNLLGEEEGEEVGSLTVLVRGDKDAFADTIRRFCLPLNGEILSFCDVHGWVAHVRE